MVTKNISIEDLKNHCRALNSAIISQNECLHSNTHFLRGYMANKQTLSNLTIQHLNVHGALHCLWNTIGNLWTISQTCLIVLFEDDLERICLELIIKQYCLSKKSWLILDHTTLLLNILLSISCYNCDDILLEWWYFSRRNPYRFLLHIYSLNNLTIFKYLHYRYFYLNKHIVIVSTNVSYD